MPKYKLAYTLHITHTDGSMEVEADTREEAVKKLQDDVGIEELLDGCSGEETEVDVHDEDDSEQVPEGDA
jgi:hypothetical protein